MRQPGQTCVVRRGSQSLSAGILLCFFAAALFGFDTGSHYDLTRAVLTEDEFGDVAIRIVQVENWLTDYYTNSPTYRMDRREILEKLHFDNLYDDEQVRAYWSVLLSNLKFSTEKAARNDDRMAMLVTLGIGLHAVQDFYSHSNWVEQHPPTTAGEFRSDTYWAAASKQLPTQDLYTGKFPDKRTTGPGPFRVPPNSALHGSYVSGLNKDSLDRPRWDEALVFAYAASHELVDAMQKWAEDVRPGFWQSVRQHTISPADEKKLREDVEAARNISMWLDAKDQRGTWKGKGSGTSRFFAAFSSKWVTDESSVFVKALRDGHVQDDLAADLYTRASAPIPPAEPYALKRTAILIKITSIAESKDENWLERHLPKTGGSDFYSRIKIGSQEFWGRTVQKSRKAIDPWFEIYFADADADADAADVPVMISVWDEDDLDPLKDEHVDINPKAGVLDLSATLRIADGILTGDLIGTFDSTKNIFTSEGRKPEKHRAQIQGMITRRKIESQ